ncbi:MAG: TraR/DksA family transcriptional regulator [Blastocatellia bacterium]|nr:TraR/DksA family transcriptional regulator [Blastocatellia bacterium]
MQEYQAIREQLAARYGEIRERLLKIEGNIRRTDQPLNADFAEQAIDAENDQVLDALDNSIRAEMSQIENTLARIDRGEYGLCEICGDPIPLRRLEAMPQATRCVACEERREA